MRAGILTYHNADNFGAVLQAYALQSVLKQLSCESELISFAAASPGSADISAAENSPLLKKLRVKAAERHAHFQSFRDRFLSVSKEYSADEIMTLDDSYDFFISGSDQVWNPGIPDFSINYFLPFAAPEKRYSYAASFGCSSFPERYALPAGQLLSDFRRISVREESAVNIVRSLTDSDSRVDLDPVLLLEPEQWSPLLSGEDEDFVFLYSIAHDSAMEKQAVEYASSLGKKLIAVTAFPFSSFGMDAYACRGVCEWLYLLSHADAIFTNSFHGAALALSFGTPLYLSLLRGDLAERNLRFVELLRLIGADYRGAQEPVYIGRERFGELILEKRGNSLEYLARIISEQDRRMEQR